VSVKGECFCGLGLTRATFTGSGDMEAGF
jgi:hypothetical protein